MNRNNSQVVVAYDFSQSGRAAMYRAIAFAARAPFHVLHFVCVVRPREPIPSVGPGPVDYRYTERVQQALADELASELGTRGVKERVHFFVHVRIGKPAEEILAVARDVGADLIVVGTKGSTGVERLLLGSVAAKIVREAGCTVEVVRPKRYDYVDLLDIKEVEAHSHYVPPHRYAYEDHRLTLRPDEWPLY